MSSAENERKRVSRRRFVRQAATGTAAAVGAGLLAGCSQPPQIVKETVEVPVEVIKEVTVAAPAPAGEACDQRLITVLNPSGNPPPIELVPMAPRLDTLDGKTIYITDVGFTDTHQLFTEMASLLSERYPSAKFEVRIKKGTYFDDDPDLWQEIKEKSHAMIMGVGH